MHFSTTTPTPTPTHTPTPTPTRTPTPTPPLTLTDNTTIENASHDTAATQIYDWLSGRGLDVTSRINNSRLNNTNPTRRIFCLANRKSPTTLRWIMFIRHLLGPHETAWEMQKLQKNMKLWMQNLRSQISGFLLQKFFILQRNSSLWILCKNGADHFDASTLNKHI